MLYFLTYVEMIVRESEFEIFKYKPLMHACNAMLAIPALLHCQLFQYAKFSSFSFYPIRKKALAFGGAQWRL